MGTVTVQSLVVEASSLLKDAGNVRWTVPALTKWLNDGQIVVAINKPSASTKNVPVPLVAGTKQSIPADGIQLIDIVRNMGAGETPGRAIRITMRELLDSVLPDWHSSKADAVVQHYMFDKQDPKNFYVYPPQPVAPSKVDMIYACTPDPAVTAITLDDIYAPALLEYMLHRAYTKDGEYEGNAVLADKHWQAFMTLLIGKAKSESGNNPNSTAPASPREAVNVS